MIMFLVIIEVLDDFGISKFPSTPLFRQISKDLHADLVSMSTSTSAVHGSSIMAVYTFFKLLSYQSLPYYAYSEDC